MKEFQIPIPYTARWHIRFVQLFEVGVGKMTVFTEAVLTMSTTLLVVNLLVGITCQKQSRPSGVSCLSQVTADKVRCGYHTTQTWRGFAILTISWPKIVRFS